MTLLRGFILLGVSLASCCLCAADEGKGSPKLVMSEGKKPADRKLEAQGLPAEVLKQIGSWKADDPRLAEWFSVYVGKKPQAGQPAILGTYEVTKTGLAFSPRFGFEAGRTYSAKLALPGLEPTWQVFEIADEKPTLPAKITAVYPSGDKLPENLLRIYLHFSAPMSQGRSYQYLQLFDESGEEVERPFLTLPQELWTPDGRRLTVLLDPGRVKQGLKPREQSGPVLVPEKKYTFTIDESWPDAKGRPLDKGFQKTFVTMKADIIQPNPEEWKITPPQAGTRDALSVVFDEPLDRGMLERVLTIVDGKSAEVPGEIQIDQNETRWQFTPETPWSAGDYSLQIQSILEDRVGNSIARPFEVNLNAAPLPPVPKVLSKRFAVGGNGRGGDRETGR